VQAKSYGSAGSNHCDGGVLWLTPDRDLQLMAQGEILENQIAAAAKRREYRGQQEKQGCEHSPEYQRVQPQTAIGAFRSTFAVLQVARLAVGVRDWRR
jgi:hypothetical protein